MQMVFGYIVGYYIIAYILIPIYYKLETLASTTSATKFGVVSYCTAYTIYNLANGGRCLPTLCCGKRAALSSYSGSGERRCARGSHYNTHLALHARRRHRDYNMNGNTVQTVTILTCLALTLYFG